jgi:deazaflavin-dependent oxidoreductase (nitroreductase family)
LNVRRTIQKLGRRTINPIAIRLLKLGLPAPPYTPKSALVLETVGRRSGRRWVTPMGYVRESADTVLVVAEHGRGADWVRNALAAGTVGVWLGPRPYRGRITVLDDIAAEEVLKRTSAVHRAMVRGLAHRPKAVRITLSKAGEPGGD